jgi:hypothetical protein
MTDQTTQAEWISPRTKLENLIREYQIVYGPMGQAQAIKEMRSDLRAIANGSILIK